MGFDYFSHYSELFSSDDLTHRTLNVESNRCRVAGKKFIIQAEKVYSDLLICAYLPKISLALVGRVPHKIHQNVTFHQPLARAGYTLLERLASPNFPEKATPEQKRHIVDVMREGHTVTFWSGATIGGDAVPELDRLAQTFTDAYYGFNVLPTIGKYAGNIFVELFSLDVGNRVLGVAYGRHTPLGNHNIPSTPLQKFRIDTKALVSLSSTPSTDLPSDLPIR